MGTRSIVKFYSQYDEESPVCAVYHQYDGYISGVGWDLAQFLIDKKVINGIGRDQTMEGGYANGIGCLAAQYIKEEKKQIGGCYMVRADSEEEFNYQVRFTGEKEITISVNYGYGDKRLIFSGTPQQLLDFDEDLEEDLED